MDPSQFINRELSWLSFNERVLDEAMDASIPLLERMKFLAITASNLDEFFMIRVGGLQRLQQQGNQPRDSAGMTPTEQLAAISLRVRQMVKNQYQCLREQLQPKLAEAGLRRVRPEGLNERQRKAARRIFEDEIFGVFTPMAARSGEDFPLLINQTLNVCVQLAPARRPSEAADSAASTAPEGRRTDSDCHHAEFGGPRFAIIPFGRLDSRFIPLPTDAGYDYMLVEDLVEMNVERFFPGERVVQCIAFRITRNADFSVREDMAADLLSGMEEVLDERKQSDCVRLELSDRANKEIRRFLQSGIGVDDNDVYAVHGPLDLSAFMKLTGLTGFDELRYEAWPPRPSPLVDLKTSMFDVVRQHDVLLSLPYESFEPVVRLIDEAADDPAVLSIKIILYRTSRQSPIVAALGRAARNNKYVTALLELKARFDEARNIEWAKALEHDGVQVIYGVRGLKTHAKVCIITRREPHGIQRYVHFATGNYNEVTARQYSDISYLTCNEELSADATSFFNAISGYSQPQRYRKIVAAPFGLRDRILELIEGEAARKREGQDAHIMAQLNAVADPKIIDALYAASRDGVKIDLNVRGICCLRPGVRGLSENIRAVSILDRYLEHCRILYFLHGGEQLVYIASADWMPRNLDRRVELLIPVEDPPSRDRLIEILKSYAADNVKARKLLSAGGYQKPKADGLAKPHRTQQYLYQLACEAEQQAVQRRRTTLVPHRSAGNGSPGQPHDEQSALNASK